ncbi:hypothetical protein Acaty_1p0016 (plasmid) [Acidithiobacillus caldus ATCC 51756]|uniref:Uncharacterized protein n=1 Tax=Acidithiobacillus caldus (strain ATCC 51756 / DSM 8584 / KU) TaxID=637389 RepID=A0A060A440_ACICK|nr:hypothetical protein Acaty_1p0016 [Acidithiobacillus caldus ATCC 51756]
MRAARPSTQPLTGTNTQPSVDHPKKPADGMRPPFRIPHTQTWTRTDHVFHLAFIHKISHIFDCPICENTLYRRILYPIRVPYQRISSSAQERARSG